MNITAVYKFQSKNIFQKRKKINDSLAWLRVENGIIKLFKSNNAQRHFVSICKSKYCDLIMRLCHPPDGSTSPKYKLLCFITTKKFLQRKECIAFNRDRCCHLEICLRLIPFHWTRNNNSSLSSK